MYMTKKLNLKKIFLFLGLIGVVLGAFGAHALKAMVEPYFLDTWKTATLYLFIHVFAGLYAAHCALRDRSAYCFLFGIFIFSGSLYTIVLTGQTFLGMLTPVGGVLFILGWFLLICDVKK